MAYYPSQARSTSYCQTVPPFLTSLSAAYHWNLISKPFSFSGLPVESLTALCFSRPHFIPLLPSISPYFLCCVPFYISSTSPRFSKFFPLALFAGLLQLHPTCSSSPIILQTSPVLYALRPDFQLDGYNFRTSLSQDKKQISLGQIPIWYASAWIHHWLQGKCNFRASDSDAQPCPWGWLQYITLFLGFSLPQ